MSVKPALMTDSPTPRPSTRWLVAAVALAAVAGLLWRFPLVRIRRLDATATKSTFDPRDFAERHWANDLLPALDAARDAGEVMAAIRRDSAEACRSLGRTVGLSRSCLYLVRGQGTIAEVGPSGCRVTLDGDAGEALLATGLVFGTAVRDVTGTVDPAARTDSRELAAAASEINRLVQERVIAPLASGANAGGRIEFVACGQVQGKLPEGTPWKLIPVQITLQEAPSGSEGTSR